MTEESRPVGRPSKYNEEVQKLADAYVKEYETTYSHPFPSVVGLAVVLEVCEKTLYNWAECNEQFLQTVDRISTGQHFQLLSRGITGEFSAPITKLALQSNHGYSDKQDMALSGPNGGPIQTDNEWHVHVHSVPEDKE